eukprot:TRINITY_DN53670_c0_g1_i1.p1 TRINITY_DN53670_c0_g1~~TRINITY_DN53670_c0_g1_i1.p1  ORF type:complete len:313 (+),score=-22.10 TRINITY_DN53670_c0_g1_i1:169-1107(+)
MYAASHTAPSSASSLLHLPQQLDHQHTNINTPTVIGAVPTTTTTSSAAIGTSPQPQHHALPLELPNEPMAVSNTLPTSKSCESHTLATPSMVLSAPPTTSSTLTTSTTQPQHDQRKHDGHAPTSTLATTTSTSPMTNTTNSARVCDVVVDDTSESDFHVKSFEGIIQLYERLMPASVIDGVLRGALKRQYKFPPEGGVNATSTTVTSDAATTLPTPSSSSVFMNNPPLVQSAPAVTTIPTTTLTSVPVSPIQSTDLVTPVPTVIASSTATPPPRSTVSTHAPQPVSYTHLRAHETVLDIVCRLLLEKKKKYL